MTIDGLKWLGIDARDPTPLHTLVARFQRTEQMSLPDLNAARSRAILGAIRWHKENSPHLREKLRRFSIHRASKGLIDEFGTIEVTTRSDLQLLPTNSSWKLPKSHEPVQMLQTSGSTGEPVRVARTGVSHLFFLANTMRDHIWWRRNTMGRMAVVRANAYKPISHFQDWGAPVSLFGASGRAIVLSLPLGLEEIKQELERFNPTVMSIFPSVIEGLMEHNINLPNLFEVRSFGEVLRRDTRERILQMGVKTVSDLYSSQEIGVMALQCPVSGLMHEMSESVLIEILDEAGMPCAVGSTGRVVVTDFTNYASPLIRYEIGDYAERGPACPCGKPHPTLRRILGRRRNLAVYPDGSRRWPKVDIHRYQEVAPIRQYQFVQTAIDTITFRYLSDRDLTCADKENLTRIFQEALGYPFKFDFAAQTERMDTHHGKFEEFVTLLHKSRDGFIS